ncbi:MAG: UDP-N-acetylmuramate dehydrogenase [Candidatus Omnitrophica bacterium]|nr:UDP-N-acetylmuramate dehydrogenase [Candidatus Omnitrophota bacterium]
MASFCNIEKIIRGRVLFDEPLKKHTTFRIGGPARVWAEPIDPKDIKEIVSFAIDAAIPLEVIGNGSNLLVHDMGLNRIAISLSAPHFKRAKTEKDSIRVGAGLHISEMLEYCCQKGLSGLERLTGIPGTIGGALAMNGGDIGSNVEEVHTITKSGRERLFKQKDISFGYRRSDLEGFIITEAKLSVKQSTSVDVRALCKKHLDEKRATQDLGSLSAGCIFKNPEDIDLSAGELVESLGFKGKRCGGALVSEKHANFIVNSDGASFGDVMELIEMIRDKAKEERSVNLELEVKILG